MGKTRMDKTQLVSSLVFKVKREKMPVNPLPCHFQRISEMRQILGFDGKSTLSTH
jgi:hypothetical protein